MEEIREPAEEKSQKSQWLITFWQESHGLQELQGVEEVADWSQGSLD